MKIFTKTFDVFFYLEKNRGSKFIFNPNFAFSIINFFASCLRLYSKLPFSHHWIITFFIYDEMLVKLFSRIQVKI